MTNDQQEPLRLFIGIEPDAATQQFLDATVAHCKRLPLPRKLRWTSYSNRHLTLAFLGDTQPDRIPELESGLSDIAAGTAPLWATIVSTHPFPKQRAKLLAAELLPNPALDALHRKCAQLTLSIGKKPEAAGFRPHFTLARSPGGFSRIAPMPTEFQCQLDNIVLYQSVMAPGGSQYHPLVRYSLCGHSE
ncbi:RNA 2',3'-cyclic phosphodiesterase [Microbulbifer celer]|uniref:RNA 2',3'-cyclic phosphodiesterase n=1 Tax=Microbulbifer celer TaxID=435905 RepID=A0ABW3UBP5_9GAMM|nr:RNA 2',3'-cyclic phosphodiesterase [Microbulbifer celer]UFN59066.1 RNA 2',3'-cyclic phosphodiesterase [Microbulbifer celer]